MAKDGYLLSEADRRVLAEMVRAWRSGMLRPAARQRQYVPGQSRYGPLWEVTAVGGGTCTVQRVDSEGELVEGTEISDVACSDLVKEDDRAILVRAGDGTLTAFVGGGAVGGLVFSRTNPSEVSANLNIPDGHVIRSLHYWGRDEDGNFIIGVNTGCLLVNP